MHKHKVKGFTLIELLVVIAIIGILSSVVLASLNTARGKGADAAIKSNLANIRAQAEIVYDGNTPNQYGSATMAAANCAQTANTLFTDPTVWAGVVAAELAAGGPIATDRCHSSPTAWMVAVPLKTNATLGWCVDSSGDSKQVTMSAVTGTVCP